MNTGVISVRYAEALLRYVQETGNGEKVCEQAKRLVKDPSSMDSVQLEPELEKFTALLVKNGRLGDVRLILISFISKYLESTGVKVALLTTCEPVPGLKEKLTPVLEKQFESKVALATTVDPELMGGFKLEVDDLLLDLSVRYQLSLIRRQLIVKNNRIV